MNNDITSELQRLLSRDGILKPEAVVAAAENPKSALHSWFTWDDTKAAHEYRLEEARRLIRVQVVTLPHTETVTRAFVSLPRDRRSGGYRPMVSVISDEEMRAEMLEDALDDAKAWRAKYATLSELSKVFAELDKVKAPKARGPSVRPRAAAAR